MPPSTDRSARQSRSGRDMPSSLRGESPCSSHLPPCRSATVQGEPAKPIRAVCGSSAALHPPHRFEHRLEPPDDRRWFKPRNPGTDPRSVRAPALRPRERPVSAQGVGQHQDVGEQDRAIHAVAPDRLQSQLGRERRGQAEFDEIAAPLLGSDDIRANSARPAASTTKAVARRSRPPAPATEALA